MNIQKIITARELRKAQTPSEAKLWQVLRNKRLLNIKFYRQYIIAGFILDFYCLSLKLGIEVDGSIHNLKDNKDYDLKRENILKQYNIKIIRFTNENVDNNLSAVVRQIKAYITDIKQNYYL